MKTLKILFLLLTLSVGKPLFAQDSHTSDTDRKWYKPDHFVIQFAGNIGLLSVGPGYSYLNDKVHTELMYGYVPGFEANTSIHILTAKNSFHPWQIDLKKGYLFEPLKIGTGLSYSFGPQFYTRLPKRYPDKYYWWAPSLRFTPFVGSTISRKVGDENTAIKRIEFYAEIGTTDLDLVSKFSNKSLSTWDILNVALGTKLVF
jgi:hypothetical protein